MVRPDKTIVLNVRVSEAEAAWVRALAEERCAGNLSSAVRAALKDARRMERVRAYLRQERGSGGLQLPSGGRYMESLLTLLLMVEGDPSEGEE